MATVFLPRDPELGPDMARGTLKIHPMSEGMVIVTGNRVRSYSDDHRKLDDRTFASNRAAVAYGRRIAGAKVR